MMEFKIEEFTVDVPSWLMLDGNTAARQFEIKFSVTFMLMRIIQQNVGHQSIAADVHNITWLWILVGFCSDIDKRRCAPGQNLKP